MRYILLSLFWITWCFVHSTMASLSVTEYLKSRLGKTFRFYRLFFNIVAAVTLLSVVLYTYSIPYQPVFRWEWALKIVQIFLFGIAILLLFAGAREYDMLHFLGIRQIKEGMSPSRLTKDGQLAMAGILGVTRHPWYVAAFVLIWARDLHLSTLLVNIILSVYFVIGTLLEERKLVLKYGDTYREYQQRVSMFLPYKWLMSKIKAFSPFKSPQVHS